MSERRRLQPELRRQQILEAAVHLFYEVGFEAASLRELAARVGINKATIYHYFENKEEILAHIIGRVGDELLGGVRRAAAETGRAAGVLERGRWIRLERSCTSCHEDIHRDRFRVECTECHDLRAWTPAPRFDHHRSEYPLTGQHTTVKCEQCHAPRPVGMKDGPSLLDPALPPLRSAECAACHKLPSGDPRPLKSKCAECHE